MYLNLDEILKIQLDHTSRCNCMCPQCGRVDSDGGVLKGLPIADLTLDDYKLILEPFHGRQYDIIHCGNFGDALVSPTFDETFDYCLSSTVRRIKIMTNGSMRTPAWWKALAEKAAGRIWVQFSIDGLEDTNHIYRVGSNFNKIIENAKAYIEGGGYAEWVFIQFDHNQHQIAEAMRMATDLGFNKFTLKTTSRFAHLNIPEYRNKNNESIVDIPNNARAVDRQKILDEYGTFKKYTEVTPITCKFKREKIIFIDMCMNVWPCCWFGGLPYFNPNAEGKDTFDKAMSLYNSDFNNLRKHGWDLLKHEFYGQHLEQSWEAPSCRYERIYTCGRTCGEKFRFSGGDDANLDETNLK